MVGKFFVFLLTLSVTSCSAAGFCFMYSSLVNVYAVVNLLSALTFVFMMVNRKCFRRTIKYLFIFVRELAHFIIYLLL